MQPQGFQERERHLHVARASRASCPPTVGRFQKITRFSDFLKLYFEFFFIDLHDTLIRMIFDYAPG